MIERTIQRLLKGISNLKVVKDLKNLIDGLAVEFYRFIDYKDEVQRSVVPNESMSVDSITDYNNLHGIPNSLGGTNAEKIARIIERSDLTGFPGKDWFEGQIQKLGFDLYVIENTPFTPEELQFNDEQFAPDVQFALRPRHLNPADFPGILVVNDPPATGVDYEFTADPARWGGYFWLSPFPSALAVNDGELLTVTTDELSLLKSTIIGSKLSRNWCVLQVKT